MSNPETTGGASDLEAEIHARRKSHQRLFDQMRDGLQEALRVARGETSGAGVTVTFAQEHILGGIRFKPGRYRITPAGPKESADVEF